jgi:hypothetical protein
MNKSIYCSTLRDFSLVAKSYDVVRLAPSRMSIFHSPSSRLQYQFEVGADRVAFRELCIRLSSVDADAVLFYLALQDTDLQMA